MLTPQDIDSKIFKQTMRGYAVDEVETFLQEVSEDYARLYRENLAAKERIEMLSDAVRQYKAMEETLQNALSVAKRSGDDVKQNAYDRAEVIVRDAQIRAEEMIENANGEVEKIRYQYEQMKRSVEVFRAKVVSLLHAQLDIIKDYSQIEVNEDILKTAKTVLEQGVKEAEAKEDADTMELPEIVRDADGNYQSADERE